MPNPTPTAKKDKVVELYEKGVSIDDIVRRTGVPRSTVFAIRKERKVTKRVGRDSETHETTPDVAEQIAAIRKEFQIALDEALARIELAHRAEREAAQAMTDTVIASVLQTVLDRLPAATALPQTSAKRSVRNS